MLDAVIYATVTDQLSLLLLKCCRWGVTYRSSVYYLCYWYKRTNIDTRVVGVARQTVSVQTNRRLYQQIRDSRLLRQIMCEGHQPGVTQFTFFMTTLLVQTYRYWCSRRSIHAVSFVHVVCTLTDK